MTRVALYARYSSDVQSRSSIEDQFRICRDQAAREKWKVVGAYKDAAISGASVTLRPGIQALLQDAQARKFDLVLAEALDRISREPREQPDEVSQTVLAASVGRRSGTKGAMRVAGHAWH